MRKHKSLEGYRSGLLVAQKRVDNYVNGEPQYECLCDCGEKSIVRATHLRNNIIKSCGCRKGNHRHGRCYTAEYYIWRTMKGRCHNINSQDFYMYGAKGITVCESWHRFESFFADMGERPSVNHSIDRIDGTKGYYKENCRWATPTEQSRNTVSNRLISFMGKTQCIAAWAAELGAPEYKLRRSLKKHSSVEDAFSEWTNLLCNTDLIGICA